MGELYNPFPKLPKNIRQIGDTDQVVRLYVEDYVNTYLKRLYPAGNQTLRVGLLLGNTENYDGTPYIFIDGAIEMEDVEVSGEKVEFSENAWKKAYRGIEESFPKRTVQGWFICGTPSSQLSPLNYWKLHNQYFNGKNKLMYLNHGLEGEEAVYITSEDGFYRLKGHCIYYERNQMMQDYMVSRKDARRVESGTRDVVIQDFRDRMEERKQSVGHARSTIGLLGGTCSVLAVLVLAGGMIIFGNYRKMRDMESVIASALPYSHTGRGNSGELEVESVPGEVYPTLADIVIDPAGGNGESGAADSSAAESEAQESADAAGEAAGSSAEKNGTFQGGNAGASADAADAAPAAATVQIPSDAVKYVVRDGETLYGICMERYHSMAQISQICAWNGLADENHISVGQELYLPAK